MLAFANHVRVVYDMYDTNGRKTTLNTIGNN